MKSVDISQVKKVSLDYRNMSADLIKNHKGLWDDPVHETFVNYNKQIKASSENVSIIFDSTSDIAKSSFDNQNLISKADKVLSEVNSL